ncbi:hypothetical protein P43SY_005134 [Pythium insidiosum]|uniref:Elicitin-like protein n=1 Tax=Pythium insidiosum TaxID=114742 RepID=A0AAD5LXI7_PYTIN|nr:hypothetical protein P43SY_005134 [Pythium insidiosum]
MKLVQAVAITLASFCALSANAAECGSSDSQQLVTFTATDEFLTACGDVMSKPNPSPAQVCQDPKCPKYMQANLDKLPNCSQKGVNLRDGWSLILKQCDNKSATSPGGAAGASKGSRTCGLSDKLEISNNNDLIAACKSVLSQENPKPETFCKDSKCVKYMSGNIDKLPDCSSNGINLRDGWTMLVKQCDATSSSTSVVVSAAAALAPVAVMLMNFA